VTSVAGRAGHVTLGAPSAARRAGEVPGHAAGVAALAATAGAAPLLLLGLGAAPFDDPGEGMHAEIARELAHGGDPFALRLNGVPYLDKPPLLYGLLAAAFALAGEGEAAARAVSAGAGLAAIAATAWLGGRWLGAAGGLLAGGALLTSVGFFAYARYVRPDALFVAALAVGFALTLGGLEAQRRRLVAAGWAAWGLAGLAKDPLGALAPPLALALGLRLTRHPAPCAAWAPAPGLAAWGVLGLGWWAVAAWRTPGFLWYTVVDNHLLNVLRTRHFPDEDVPLAAGEFLLVALLGAAPWALAAGASVVDLVRGRAWRRPEALPWVVLALWAVGGLLLTTLAPFRLPHYGLPFYPALALLAARGWLRAGRALAVAHAGLLGALALGLALAARGDPASTAGLVLGAADVATRKARDAAEAAAALWAALAPWLGPTAGALGVGALGLAAAAAARAPRAGAWAALAAMLAVLPAVAAALATVAEARAVRGLARAVAARAGADELVAHEGPLENSGAFEWYAGRRPVLVDARRSVLGFAAARDGARVFWDEDRLRAAWTAGRVWLVTTRPPARSLAARLPGARLVAAEGGRWLWVSR